MNWRTYCVFVLSAFILLLINGCSTLNFIASGRTPFKISYVDADNDQQAELIEGTRDFYFWGISPGEENIDLEDEGNRQGWNLPSHVTISQTTGWKSLVYSILTLGLYCPVDYTIAVLTHKEDQK